MAGVIARSSNIGTALAASQFTPAQLWSYLDKFGLGRRTSVGLPGEATGSLPPASTWSTLTRAQVAFGQGLSVNALQMATAVNTVANGGELRLAQPDHRSRHDRDRHRRGHRHRHPPASGQHQRGRADGEDDGARHHARTWAPPPAPASRATGWPARPAPPRRSAASASATATAGSRSPSPGSRRPTSPASRSTSSSRSRPAAASGGGTTGPVFRSILSYVLQKYAVPPTGTTPSRIPIEWTPRRHG